MLEADLYRLAADVVLTLHFAFVLFVVGGLMAIYLGRFLKWNWVRNRLFRISHLAAISIVIAQAWLGMICPLTTLEMRLRILAGQESYGRGFIEHWVSRLLFFEAPTSVFLIAYTLFGLLVLASWWVVRPHASRRSNRGPAKS